MDFQPIIDQIKEIATVQNVQIQDLIKRCFEAQEYLETLNKKLDLLGENVLGEIKWNEENGVEIIEAEEPIDYGVPTHFDSEGQAVYPAKKLEVEHDENQSNYHAS